jgi:uncharacterized protein (TIGR03435 family)
MTSISFRSSLGLSGTIAGRAGIGFAVNLLLALASFGQPSERPKFEVASVKLASEPHPMAVRPMPGGRLVASAPLKLLIMNAYNLQRSEIIGGPEWVNDDRYDIEAKAADNASRSRLMLMLQSLLEDRFQMRIHHETRDTPLYALVVDKKGSKLVPTKITDCPDASTATPPTAPPCGQVRISPSASDVRMEGDRVPVSDFAQRLAVLMNEPLLDRTNLTGEFDIRLRFVNEVPGTPSDTLGPTIFTALQDQLGLKLESTRGPVEFLVIDHVERPSAN